MRTVRFAGVSNSLFPRKRVRYLARALRRLRVSETGCKGLAPLALGRVFATLATMAALCTARCALYRQTEASNASRKGSVRRGLPVEGSAGLEGRWRGPQGCSRCLLRSRTRQALPRTSRRRNRPPTRWAPSTRPNPRPNPPMTLSSKWPCQHCMYVWNDDCCCVYVLFGRLVLGRRKFFGVEHMKMN